MLEGDATRNATLAAVKIERAKCVAVSAGRDDTSILIVLTARGMAPHVPISVVVKAEDNEDLARQAGATTVINPASFAGLLLAGSAHGPHIAEYMADLAATDGSVALREREVTAAEAGRPLSAIGTGLGVRIYRGGRSYGFWDIEAGGAPARRHHPRDRAARARRGLTAAQIPGASGRQSACIRARLAQAASASAWLRPTNWAR